MRYPTQFKTFNSKNQLTALRKAFDLSALRAVFRAAVFVIAVMAVVTTQAKRTNEELLDRGTWQELTEGLEYPIDTPSQTITLPQTGNWLGFANAFKYVFYVMVAGVFLYLLYRLYRQLKEHQPEKPAKKIVFQHLHEAEENLRQANLEPALKEALAQNNYQLALRILYLMTIAHLDDQSAITWKKQKTNGDYQRELRNHPFLFNFQRLTVNFERSWYGSETITQEIFNDLKALFDQLVTKKSTN
jgi:hypothetical protein